MSREFGSRCRLPILALTLFFLLGGMGCKQDPVSVKQADANCSAVTIFPNGADYGEFFPDHVAGDCQFGPDWNMHGPKVTVQANLRIDASKTEIWLTCSMDAVETESDWTEAEGSWDTLLYVAPAGWYVNKITSAPSATGEYTDTNILWDKIETSLCDFDVMGNTLLNDVCNTIVDGDATRMKIHLKPISIVLCDQKR